MRRVLKAAIKDMYGKITRMFKCRVDGLPVCLLEQSQVVNIGGDITALFVRCL